MGQAVTLDEINWVERAKSGDAAGFEAILARYERQIYGFICRLMGNTDDAEDLTQECFLRAYANLPKTREEVNLSAWLHRIAANACMDVLRRRKLVRWLPLDVATDQPATSRHGDSDPADTYMKRESREEVVKVLNRLTPRYRMCLLLREYQDLSYDEMAEVMGVSPAAVKSTLFRAREQFRELYAASGGAR